MSSETQDGSSLSLSNPDLNFRVYGEQFGISANRQGVVSADVDEVMWHIAEQTGFGGSQQFANRRERAVIAEQAVGVDQVNSELQVWQQLVALFGSPDTSSNLVMSVVLLFNAHRERLKEKFALSKAELAFHLHDVLTSIQERARLAQIREKVVLEERARIQTELLELQAAEHGETRTNIKTLETGLAPFADNMAVAALKVRASEKKNLLRGRLSTCKARYELISAEVKELLFLAQSAFNALTHVGEMQTPLLQQN